MRTATAWRTTRYGCFVVSKVEFEFAIMLDYLVSMATEAAGSIVSCCTIFARASNASSRFCIVHVHLCRSSSRWRSTFLWSD